MTVVQINATCSSGSTGKIVLAVSRLLCENGVENYILYSHGNDCGDNTVRFMKEREGKIQALVSRVLGNYGFNARAATKRVIRELDRIKPDIVHLHNLHTHDLHMGRQVRCETYGLNP